MTLQYNGVLTVAAQKFIRDLLEHHKFLLWSGKFSADVLGLFNKHLPCDCTSADEVEQKWACFQKARLKNMSSGPDWTSFAQVKAEVLGHTAESAQRAVAVVSELECLLGENEVALQAPLQFAQSILSELIEAQQRHTITRLVNTPAPPTPTFAVQPSIAQPSSPQTPLSLMSPQVATDVSPQPDTPRVFKRFKRLRLLGDAYGDGTSICDRQEAFLQSNGDTSAQCGGDGNQRNQSMNKDEQQSLLAALSRTLNSLTENDGQVTLPLIQQEQWLLFKALRNSVDVLSACLSQQHAGVPGRWTRSIASKTIANVDATPLLKQCLADLQEWNEGHHITCVPVEHGRVDVAQGSPSRPAAESSGHCSVTPYRTKSYLRLVINASQSRYEINAICMAHPGTICRISRGCYNNRPIGFLWWWLGQGRGRTSDEHKALARGKGPTYAQRFAARQSFECIPGVEDFLAAEAGGVGQGEPLIYMTKRHSSAWLQLNDN